MKKSICICISLVFGCGKNRVSLPATASNNAPAVVVAHDNAEVLTQTDDRPKITVFRGTVYLAAVVFAYWLCYKSLVFYLEPKMYNANYNCPETFLSPDALYRQGYKRAYMSLGHIFNEQTNEYLDVMPVKNNCGHYYYIPTAGLKIRCLLRKILGIKMYDFQEDLEDF